MGTKKWIIALCVVLCGLWSQAQTTLTAGDIAIIGYDTDDPDMVVFVPMVDLSAGTVIKFTDNGWTGTAFTTNEGTYTYTASAAVPKGTVVQMLTTGMSLSTSGDQIFAYQGLPTAPAWVYGLSTKPWLTTGAPTSNTSYRPAGLIDGTSALAFSLERDNGFFNQTTVTGNASTILPLIGNALNWTTTDTRVSPFPNWSFSIGALANEPTANPTTFNATGILSWKHTLSWNAVSPAPAGYIVLRKQGSAPTSAPVDGLTYLQGDMIGDAKVALNGTALTLDTKGTLASTAYYYRVYAYNGTGTMTNYRQLNPLAGLVNSSGNGMGTYYQSINHLLPTFVADLQTRIRNPHVKISYDLYDETMMTDFAFRDTSGARRVATCAYSGTVYTYTPPFVWYTASPFSREHTWCQSWMPNYPSTAGNEYSDQHHLYPVDQVNANIVRSNHPLGTVVTVLSTFGGDKYGKDANSNLVFEPRDSDKGDAARALLYMSLRYNGDGGQDWTIDHLNAAILPSLSEGPLDLGTLLSWHTADPPDNYEIARNDYIYSLQQNRNPFVDNPAWVNYIQWSNLGFIPHKTSDMVVQPEATLAMSVYPVPLRDLSTVRVAAPTDGPAELKVMDMTGRTLIQEELLLEAGENRYSLHTEGFASGVYLVVVTQGVQSTHTMVSR